LPPGLEDFFRLAGRSREHVTRVCRQQTGLTPGELVTSIRLEYAARYLERSDLSVTDVAEVAGFGNLSAFHRHFRAATGLTPLRYRRGRRSVLPVA